MNVILCGMMGAGKTTVGIALATLLGWQWRDTDAVIEEKYGKISDIFATLGEPRFREMETEIVRELCPQEDMIISVGGGLVLKEENVALLKENGKIVYLRARKETLLSRLRSDTSRPLLQGEESLEEKIERLLRTRASVYESVADLIVDVDKKTPQEIAAEIVEKIKG